MFPRHRNCRGRAEADRGRADTRARTTHVEGIVEYLPAHPGRTPWPHRANELTESICIIVLLRNCAFKIFRKCGFKDGLVCLVGFCSVHSQAAVGCAIKG